MAASSGKPILIRRSRTATATSSTTTQAKSHRAVSEATAFLMASMLADVINAGTAYRARQTGFTLPAAGKTGTTNDYVDAWFVGFTPHLVTGVWIGFDQPSDDHFEWLRRRARGADLGELHEGRDQGRQAGLVRASGQRDRRQRLPRVGQAAERAAATASRSSTATASSRTRSMVYTEYFVTGTQPTDMCPLHPSSSLDGRLAGVVRQGHRSRPSRRAGRQCRSADRGPTARPATRRRRRRPTESTAEAARPTNRRRNAASGDGLRPKDDEDDDKKKKEDKKKDHSGRRTVRLRCDSDSVSCLHAISRHHRAPPLLDARWRGAAARESLPPSLIFAGPDGVGKRMAAVALAQLLNCHAVRSNVEALRDRRSGCDACGICASCTRIARGVHADVLLIEPGDTGAIKVDQVRDAIERTAYRPFEGRRRVVIVDDADALNVGSAERAAQDARGAARRRRCSCW